MNVFDYFFEKTNSLSKQLVLGPRETISYKEIYDNSLLIAKTLIDRIGVGNNIILLNENSVFFITAYLAILKSGNVCIPLNPGIEKENLENIIRQSEPELIISGKRYLNKFEGIGISLISDSDFQDWIDNSNSTPEYLSQDFDENKLAEIIFTSGSTGEQKGVMITHKNIIANTNSIIEYLQLTSNDTIQIVLPFYYCYGLSLLHTHLRVGGSVVLNNSFIFLGSVINDLKKYNCTGFSGVPSHFQILLRKSKDFKSMDFPNLKYVTQAGGKLHNSFIKEFTESFPDVQFIVMYGQTEATARLSYLPPSKLKDKLGSMGKGIPGVELKVVNSKGNFVKPGEVGEIVAKGDNIMPGYYKDTEATNEAIRNDWLFTGDMATIDDDGYIFIQSRKKEIIKVRGIRISPKEIEEIIVAYPGVVDCTIEAETDEITGEALKAIVYINDADLEIFSEDIIKQHCADNLASHKIPQKVVFETKLTFNAAGKKTKS